MLSQYVILLLLQQPDLFIAFNRYKRLNSTKHESLLLKQTVMLQKSSAFWQAFFAVLGSEFTVAKLEAETV